MKRALCLMIAAILAPPLAGAADSMRCGSRVVAAGDPKAKVTDLCGKPAQTEKRTVYRSGIPRQEFRADTDTGQSVSDRELLLHGRSLVETEVDVWIYNPGRSRLLREVVFLDGRVVEVNVLGRGY